MNFSIPEASPVLVALSGGADSVCLFHLTAAACRERGKKFYACHVNHGIRGDEALRDRDFCIALAKACPECEDIFVLDADVPALAAEHGKSLETEAREVRYAFFERVMKEHGIKTLMTAHNADDNLETLIFNLTRGTGPRGMCGIPHTRRLSDNRTVERPLLAYSKSEILDECEKNGWEYVTDSTNADTGYSRNLIRHEVIPLLEKINPAVRNNAARLAETMRELCSSVELDGELDGKIPLSLINSAHPAALPGLFSRFASELQKVHIDALYELCRKGAEGSSVSLPHKMRGVIRDEKLIFEADVRESVISEDYELLLTEGENKLPDGSTLLFLTGDAAHALDLNIYKFATKAKLNFDTISITAKNRRAGDKIMVKGTHRELRKIFSEARLPTDARTRIPVIEAHGEIVAVPGVAAADKVFTKTDFDAVFVWKN